MVEALKWLTWYEITSYLERNTCRLSLQHQVRELCAILMIF